MVNNDGSTSIVILNLDEPYTRDDNDRFIAENEKIYEIFFMIGATTDYDEFERIGEFKPGECRALVINFASIGDKESVLKAAKRFPQISGWERVIIRDYNKYMEDERQSSSYNFHFASEQIFPPHMPPTKQNEEESYRPIPPPRIYSIPPSKLYPPLNFSVEEQTNPIPESTINFFERNNEKMHHKTLNEEQIHHSPINLATTPPPSYDETAQQLHHENRLYSRSTSLHQASQAYSQFQTGPSNFSTHLLPQPPNNKDSIQDFGNPFCPNPEISSSSSSNTIPSFQHFNPAPSTPGNMEEIRLTLRAMMDQIASAVQSMNAMTQPNLHEHNAPEPSSPELEVDSSNSSDDEDEEQMNLHNTFYRAVVQKHSGRKKTLNILVLGETGVGKSTWINGIANYLTFYTLDEAIKSEKPICLIATKYSIKDVKVVLEPTHGERDNNEVLADGESATQNPKTYQFETPKHIINIIDTPGIGDTRGPEQDKENIKKIIKAIGNYKKLHAICFLFKSNENRLTTSFRFCISELLLQLRKDAVDNIIFFFTHARGSFYKAGDTATPLSAYFTKLATKCGSQIDAEKIFNPKKMFHADNEAFRLVCAKYSGVKFTKSEIRNYNESWTHSASETQRFIEYILTLKPHKVENILSINKTRTIILYLAKPLADVNELIETNIRIFDDRKAELENTANNLADLKTKLQIPKIEMDVKVLENPRTVCAGKKCIKTQRIRNSDQFQTIYEQICHDNCYLYGIDVEKFPQPQLLSCEIMAGGICQKCKCSWMEHMHIRFEQVKTSVLVEDENVRNAIITNENAALTKQKMIKDCEERIKELKAEQQKIIKTSLKFGSFLQANAILPYNDAFENYVQQSIEQAEAECFKIEKSRSKLYNLRKLLDEYQQEKRLMEEAAKHPDQKGAQKITASDIKQLQKELFELKHTGRTLKTLFKATDRGISKHNAHVTVKYTPPWYKISKGRRLWSFLCQN